MAVEGIYTEKEKCENVYFNLVDNGEVVTLELVDENGNHVMCGNICNIVKIQVGLINAVMLTVNLGLLLILMVV
jgi:hypothetical protein